MKNAGFLTIKSILGESAPSIAEKVGVDLYIAQIILQEAERVSTKMAEMPLVYDLSPTDNADPAAVVIDEKSTSSISP
ncbi:MAG TPA: hypothetical protein VFR94_17480 [Nitrososphaeraceae archaeon]|nr:hypothetical protein [Nitrososphaeraceae archaeon]